MVVLTEAKNMFWGVTLDGGKRYSQTVEHSFHISMAAMEVKTEPGGGDKKSHGCTGVMIQHDKAEFLLCTLSDKIPQTQLDLNFSEGEDVTFFLNGNGVVHLTGYLLDDSAFDNDLPDDEDELLDEEQEMSDEESEDESDLEEGEVPNLMEDIEEEDSEDDEDFDPMSPSKEKKRKKGLTAQQVLIPAKKSKMATTIGDLADDDDDDDEDDDDVSFDEEDDSDLEDEMDSDEEEEVEEGLIIRMAEEDDEDEDEDEEDEAEETPEKVKHKKTPKSDKKKPKDTPKSDKKIKHQNGKSDSPTKTPKSKDSSEVKSEETSQNGTPASSKKKKKNKKNKGEGEQSSPSQDQKTPGKSKEATDTPKSDKKKTKSEETPGKNVKKTLPGGTIVEILSEGHGPEAKANKMVSVYYRGSLKQSGKPFDECMKGKPFKFKLGKGEVIKGWDAALQGMKVGGKRKVTVPPAQGYGNSRVGPIPPGSTLVFDIELKAVS